MGETDFLLRGTILLALVSESWSERNDFRYRASGDRDEADDVESLCTLPDFAVAVRSSVGVIRDLPLL